MRKNAPRKWIHAILDLLPLFVIPIFAININQKSIEPISIEVEQNQFVDFNQNVKNGNFEDISHWIVYSGTGTIENNALTINNAVGRNGVRYDRSDIVYNNHYYYAKVDVITDVQLDIYFTYPNVHALSVMPTNTYTQVETIFKFYYNGNNGNINFDIFPNGSGTIGNYTITNVQLFDLTEMNLENITTSEFNSYFTSDYYPYNTGEIISISTTNTYDNTDIGSQFLYSIYKPINDYFNFNNLFNINDVWNWIQLNLFSGSAPLPVFIVWNIILYEFFIDLIFLLYSVFMFIIDFATNCLERPFNKVR